MSDVVDFRVSDALAVGHDDLNVIVFRRDGRERSPGRTNYDGFEWRAVSFIYRDKAVLLRCLRELGYLRGTETSRPLASMSSDLRTYRAAFKNAEAA